MTGQAKGNIHVVDCGSSRIGKLLAILGELGVACGTVPLSEANARSFEESAGVIISGGPHLFTDEAKGEQLAGRFAFIGRLNVPTLGICLGHQAIGVRSGVTPYRGAERRTEDRIHIVSSDHPLVEGLPGEAVFAEDHCEGIPLPGGFSLLGFSKYYPVEIMVCNHKPVFGVQFHPEISGREGRILLRNFVGMIVRPGCRADGKSAKK